jgi:hypothetical protein
MGGKLIGGIKLQYFLSEYTCFGKEDISYLPGFVLPSALLRLPQ